MRGDRPLCPNLSVLHGRATPHARGSTCVSSKAVPPLHGYPACAGIDPAYPPVLVRIYGLPRMRGDRPDVRISAFTDGEATPHARGSTFAPLITPPQAYGYPACAGIDPRRRQREQQEEWLPRMRGDRPISLAVASAFSAATPHARGSTWFVVRVVGFGRGYPACAGIDPGSCPRCPMRRRLPRMRGDRPSSPPITPLVTLATPHARGSTCRHWLRTWLFTGYPACAGIDPTGQMTSMYPWRLPRMRGDRPFNRFRRNSLNPATPHARGSTSTAVLVSSGFLGYPACAGIDLVGVDDETGRMRLPRMRGDRPAVSFVASVSAGATPHARGSTQENPPRPDEPAGYPACAGIDLDQESKTAKTRWLPRMRGDRPVMGNGMGNGVSATPHARGSTSRSRRGPR